MKKSPNTPSRTSERSIGMRRSTSRRARLAVLALALAPFLLVSCKSTESDVRGHNVKNPYAQNNPQTPEEEAYYRDVYSGDWEQGDLNGLKSIGKTSASLTMPEHWRSMPHGAVTLDDIRRNSAQRRAAQTPPGARPYASIPQPQYAQNAAAAGYGAPAAAPTAEYPSATQYPSAAYPANAYPASAYPAQVAPAQPTYPNPPQTPNVQYVDPAYSANVAPQAQYVAAAPTEQSVAPVTAPAADPVQTQPAQPQVVAPEQPVYAPTQPEVEVVQPQPQPQPQPSVTEGPAPYAYPVVEPNAESHAPTQNVYPAPNNYADNSTIIIRGQEPDDDPFGEDEQDEVNPFDVDDQPADEDVVDAEEDEENKVDAPAAQPAAQTADEPAQEPVAKVTRQNVVEKPTASGASVKVGRIGGSVMPLIVDPTIAAPYAKVTRPLPNPSAPNRPDDARAKQGEYLVSGGDSKQPFFSREDWSIENLDPEDAAAHFDTLDGRILTEPSNRVFIYSPRFGAVRQVFGPIEGTYRENVASANTTVEPNEALERAAVDVRVQETKPLGANGSMQVAGAQTAAGADIATGALGVLEGDSRINISAFLTSASVDDLANTDSSLILDSALAAQGWSAEEAVEVRTDLVNAFSNIYAEGAATIYSVRDDTKSSKLRVIKIANKDAARPGEFVEFTLRFENIGTEPLGNITLLDNLSTRLRYVEGTAKSSLPAEFLAELSESGSLVLRWEITDPLPPKEFGVVTFICKVM
ncbi:MAG: hypothetical protein Q4G03_06815 [Planctomycetia bacterium]|nr:hypothetical protein [Planctomycetia bacterium]